VSCTACRLRSIMAPVSLMSTATADFGRLATNPRVKAHAPRTSTACCRRCVQGAKSSVGDKSGGKPQLQLLHGITGSFRPGVLTALMGVSGAVALLGASLVLSVLRSWQQLLLHLQHDQHQGCSCMGRGFCRVVANVFLSGLSLKSIHAELDRQPPRTANNVGFNAAVLPCAAVQVPARRR
jgi:hypothetical protein